MSIEAVGFLGGGQMASALAGGLRKGCWADVPFFVTDRYEATAQAFAERFRAEICPTVEALARECDVVFLCVKPQDVEAALPSTVRALFADKLLVSVVAGLRIQRLAELAGADCHICRSMPNTAAEVARAVTAVCFSGNVTEDERMLIRQAFSTVGACLDVAEEHFDTVVALGGSGPAYACLLVEEMTAAGVVLGLPEPVALELAARAVHGAAELMLQTGRSPADIRKKISSPGGTTLAALGVLDERGVREAVRDAVHAAARRSQELSGAK